MKILYVKTYNINVFFNNNLINNKLYVISKHNLNIYYLLINLINYYFNLKVILNVKLFNNTENYFLNI